MPNVGKITVASADVLEGKCTQIRCRSKLESTPRTPLGN